MNTDVASVNKLGSKRAWSRVQLRHGKLALGYLALLLIPFAAAQFLEMDHKGTYLTALSALNLIAMMAFFIQFPLGSRLKQISLFANIDWNMAKHKRVGQWVGAFFLLHPLLIVAPRFVQSYEDGLFSLTEVITAPKMLTGVIAWVIMVLWTLMAIFKNKLKMSYEVWRFTHLVGFVIIAILATLHITSVGSHGQFEHEFNMIWWALCTTSILMVLYNYIVKKLRVKAKPFELVGLEKVSSRDWQVTLESREQDRFEFEAGQFIWMNTSGSAFNVKEHPFSIASCKSELPQISLIIRELGDYTSNLSSLSLGQNVFIDGPYGSLSLAQSKKSDAIVLIAGGAGIGPMLSLLRELAANQDPRPVRLVYGNAQYDQMVLQEEINGLESSMLDFRQQLVCMEPTEQAKIHQGVIDQACLEPVLSDTGTERVCVYLCGPKGMIKAVNRSLKKLNVAASAIHYEQLSF